ncbi:dihydrodipicolinate synthase family protein [Variovorax sp. J31P207]|uniref:dihydrodipicolinate synthase family protein n=1 Tax=Variovorax sp. J31P207 TaxID=3053510 RepID=UPI00257756BD|nr:dihydrodipicolinate synthase family protein [Variovorax sp. J31P207]MDM0067034.1 dihydrodipicolinate synthase family protein [Variovorax sp. J31P207]
MTRFSKKELAHRNYIAMVNPWLSNSYQLDEPALRRLVQYFLKQGEEHNIGLIVNPEAGELFYMSRQEKQTVTRIVMDEVAGRVPVLAGVLDVTTEGTVRVAKDMKELKVDGLFVMPPIGAIDVTTSWNPTLYPEVWLDDIKAIDEACDLPMIAHPVGSATMAYGIGIPTETTMAICDAVTNMIGWKMTYNWEGWKRVGRALHARKNPVTVLGACAAVFHEAIACDLFDGTVTGSFNYAMEPMLQHMKLSREGRAKEALALWDGGLCELQEWMYSDLSRLHLRYKVACWLRGLVPHPYMRRPMPAPKPEEIAALVRLLRGAGLSIIDDAAIAALPPRPPLPETVVAVAPARPALAEV